VNVRSVDEVRWSGPSIDDVVSGDGVSLSAKTCV
jgi:hypothetical protein